MSLIKKVLQLKRKKISLFTTPSHGQKTQFKSFLGDKYYSYDLSEIDGLDNLNCPKDCILELQEHLQEIYCSGFTHPLTNGSTQGILALMLAVLNPKDKVLIAANCHTSVHNGLVLTGAEPVWMNPNFNSDFGFFTAVSSSLVEKKLNEINDIRCLILTNPSYDGALSNIEKISAICKEKNVILIVDEAHGALWNFDKTLGSPAILCGADASVQSLHKTCGAVNPAALIHLSKNSVIPKNRLMDSLNLISTTSPSYPMVINIEETVKSLHSKNGKSIIDKLIMDIMWARKEFKKLEFLELYDNNCDITKIVVRPLRMSAEDVCEILYSKFKLECEIQHARSLTFLCGIGTNKQKLKKLVKALKYINKISKIRDEIVFSEIDIPERVQVMLPQTAFNSEFEEVLPNEAADRISASVITSYPPGIPILTYGEKIQKEHIKFLNPDTKIRIVK